MNEYLTNSPWYRFLKVAYIAAYLIGLLFVGIIANSVAPRQVTESDKTSIVCDNGETYNLSRSKLYEFQLEEVGSDEDLKVRRACQSNHIVTNNETNEKFTVRPEKLASYGLEVPAIPATKNYTIKHVYKTVGSWNSVVAWFLVGTAILFVVVEIIKSASLYILGISVWRGIFVYIILLIAFMFEEPK